MAGGIEAVVEEFGGGEGGGRGHVIEWLVEEETISDNVLLAQSKLKYLLPVCFLEVMV